MGKKKSKLRNKVRKELKLQTKKDGSAKAQLPKLKKQRSSTQYIPDK